jgi:hypothetical protein
VELEVKEVLLKSGSDGGLHHADAGERVDAGDEEGMKVSESLEKQER